MISFVANLIVSFAAHIGRFFDEVEAAFQKARKQARRERWEQ